MSYLEGYGVGQARQERLVAIIFASLIAVILAGVVFYFWQRDRTETQKVSAFLDALRIGDHKAAYTFWGCSYEQPCRDYPYSRFLEDWGTSTARLDAVSARSDGGQHCKAGRIEVVRYSDQREVQLWVERKTQVIGYAPWPIDTGAPKDFATRLRRIMRDLVGDCAPTPMKVP
ncbi:MAG: hypothetical protein H7039_02095 [Bryobacteraceae bacterium]|nr:hypothetical protein [Bryobacteraceae bacterium]